MKDISSFTKKRIHYKDLIEPGDDYAAVDAQLTQWIEQGVLRPIKKAGRAQFSPHFYNEYFVNEEAKQAADLSELNLLAPVFLEYYISHPEQYAEDRECLIPLSSWMKESSDSVKCSVKERSYEIFRNEKMLEGPVCRRILSRTGLEYKRLNCYRAYEPFFYEKFSDHGIAVVLENKDPWYSLRMALHAEKTSRFLGNEIMYVIYGEGRKVDSKEIHARLQDFIDALEYQPEMILYCGDIDRAGVSIYTTCRNVNPELVIEPFIQLYDAMIRKAPEDFRQNEASDDHKTRTYDRTFADQFGEHEYVENVLAYNLRIPQEILRYEDYLNMCGR